MTKSTEDHLYVADTERTGKGLFTHKAFDQHQVVFVLKGDMRFFASRTREETHRYENWIGLGRDRWIDPAAPYVFLNHSCEPNLAICHEREFVALRHIEPGEELTFDYSISEDELLWTMRCACGTKSCRGTIGPVQLLPTEVVERYRPYVNTYFVSLHYEYVDAQSRKRA
jgi:hypothetical protein